MLELGRTEEQRDILLAEYTSLQEVSVEIRSVERELELLGMNKPSIGSQLSQKPIGQSSRQVSPTMALNRKTRRQQDIMETNKRTRR